MDEFTNDHRAEETKSESCSPLVSSVCTLKVTRSHVHIDDGDDRQSVEQVPINVGAENKLA